ncbi:MAG: non-homologous end-joining DNA ligase, partial [Peptococcaceae bacterium]|nr:non-homologous end-joining DNA ligase [Peptococcaceae bacterium]
AQCYWIRWPNVTGFGGPMSLDSVAQYYRKPWPNSLEYAAMILDGEMVVTDTEGKTDFQALQNYMADPKGGTLTYIVFDILALDGADLREYRLIQRKEILESLMLDAPETLFYSNPVQGNGTECFLAACKANLEGIVGKKADSVYSGAKNGDWIKLKCNKRQEFVIAGYTLSDKKTTGISSLLLGLHAGEEFIYAGRAGTGLSTSDIKDLEAKFETLKRLDPPFKLVPKTKPNETLTWLDPKLVAEIQFSEWTKDNLLRQASFKGLRLDKDSGDVKSKVKPARVKPAGAKGDCVIQGIKITNPDRVVFENPALTKADVVRYYEKVSERMLPYISHRILSIVRCPGGISQPCFYKKHPRPDSQGIITIENASGLIFEAQMGTLEFHIWGSRADEQSTLKIIPFLDNDIKYAFTS